MNGLNNFDKTDTEYLSAPTDDLIRFWRSKVKVTAGRGELWRRSPYSSYFYHFWWGCGFNRRSVLYVCLLQLSVNSITQKVMDGFSRNFVNWYTMDQRRVD